MNLITIISIAVIAGFFLYYFIQAIKLYRLNKILERAITSDNSLEYLKDTKLVSLYESYKETIYFKYNDTIKSNIPSSEYFSELNTSKAIKLNLRMLDTASGTLVGLGLLGTFLGLTLGVGGFDSSDVSKIQMSIEGL